jgi:RNA polymerase sigma-70 factor, ECF subfamily
LTDISTNPNAEPHRSLNVDQTQRSLQNRAASEAEKALLTRAGSGDQQAMTELFDRYGSLVYSVALRVLNDPGQAEDVMQEIFFQVWRNPDAFVSGRGSLGAWLAVMARNRAIDALRQRRPTDQIDEVVLPAQADFSSDIDRSRMMDTVRKILKNLPREQQNSVELAFFEGLSHSEIAARTGDPLGTVKTRIRSALLTLRKAISA